MFERLVDKNFPNLMNNITYKTRKLKKFQVRPIRHIVPKLFIAKGKENMFLIYRAQKIKPTVDLPSETIEVRMQWNDILRAMSKKQTKTKVVNHNSVS